jgi:CheY-like chemotaxis protein
MSKSVLVVEDQAEIRDLIRLTLEMGGYRVSEAADGESALQMADKALFDLILLDVRMPGKMDGLAVCEALKRDQRHRRTKIVMLSAADQSTDLRAGKTAGADKYLTKPFSPRQLLSVVAATV